jgi:hypothetical protein
LILRDIKKEVMAKRDKKKIGIRLNLRALPKVDNLTDFLILKKRDGGLMVGHNVDSSLMNLALYGSMDPDTEMLRGVSKEMWECAYPKLRRGNSFGIPIIFGTGGGGDLPSQEYYKKMVVGDFNFDYFIPGTVEESGPFPIIRESMVFQLKASISRSEYMSIDEIVNKLSKR